MKINQFKTQQKLKNYLKFNLNHKCELEKRIEDAELIELLSELVNNHYWAEGLIGAGIDYFFVRKCPVYPDRNRTFHIMRKDGTVSDFSYLKAIKGARENNEKYAKRAFRVEIEYQTKEFKRRFFSENSDSKGYCVCEQTGLKFNIKTAHVDHAYPKTFDSLFYAFLQQKGIAPHDVEITYEGSEDVRPILKDRALAEEFKNWHAINAELRCIYWRANLQHKKTKDFAGRQIELHF